MLRKNGFVMFDFTIKILLKNQIYLKFVQILYMLKLFNLYKTEWNKYNEIEKHMKTVCGV